jgi:hypothetical protein
MYCKLMCSVSGSLRTSYSQLNTTEHKVNDPPDHLFCFRASTGNFQATSANVQVLTDVTPIIQAQK